MRGLLLICLLLSGCGGASPESVRAADALYAQGRWEQAATAYAALPESAGAWRSYGAWRAAALRRDALRDPEGAAAGFKACARRWEDQWGYACQVDLGDLERDLGRPRSAIDAYRKALEVRPRGSRAEHCLLESGRAYVALGEPAQARVDWDELVRTFPGSALRPTVAVESARAFDLEGLYSEALAAYLDAQKRWPDHSTTPLAVFGEAEALEQLGRLDDAEEAFDRALQVYPNPDAVRLKLKRLKARKERRQQKTTVVPDRHRGPHWR